MTGKQEPKMNRNQEIKKMNKPRDIAGSQTLGNRTEARKLTSLQFSYQLFRLFDGILVSTASQRFGGYVSYLFLSPFRTFPCEKSTPESRAADYFHRVNLTVVPVSPKRPTAYSGFSRTASSAPQQTHGSEWNPASSNLGCLEDELTSSV